MKDIYIDIREENDTIRNYFKKDLISIDEMLGAIEELKWEIDRLNEQIETKDEKISECYKHIKPYEYYGVSERSFI